MMEITAALDDHKALRKIAAALLSKAAGFAQALIGDSQEDAMQVRHTIVRKIVEPDAKA